MGTVSSLFDRIFNRGGSDARILMIGLDGAGKTTLLYKIIYKATITTIRTIGFNVETVCTTNGLRLTVWDVGGQGNIRPLWRNYSRNTDGIVYVVDSSDTERFLEAKEWLDGFLASQAQNLQGVPVLVIANKQDLPDAVSAKEIVNQLDLTNLEGRKWYVQTASAIKGEGLQESIDQLASMVKEFMVTNPR